MSRHRLAELAQHPAHLIAGHIVTPLVRHRKALLEHLHRFIRSPQLDKPGSQQLINLGKLRTYFQRSPKRLNRFLGLTSLHQQLSQPKVTELILRVIIGHLSKLADAIL
jgi:hypothetical protein